MPASKAEQVLEALRTLLATVPKLGNLVLAEDSINRPLGNRPYSSKRSAYAGSQFLLTRALAERLTVGASPRIDRAVAELEPSCDPQAAPECGPPSGPHSWPAPVVTEPW